MSETGGRSDWDLDIFVPGRPAAQGSKRHVGGGRLVEQSKAVGPWRTVVAWHVAQAWSEAPLDGPIRCDLRFVVPRPKAAPKRVTPQAITRPDLDKYVRCAFDAITTIVWRDDSQVVELTTAKYVAEIDERPGVRIRIVRGPARRDLTVCELDPMLTLVRPAGYGTPLDGTVRSDSASTRSIGWRAQTSTVLRSGAPMEPVDP